jgi:hypothetical protein
MTVEDWVERVVKQRQREGMLGRGELEAYRRGMVEGFCAFLIRERARHQEDIGEITQDVNALRARFGWLAADAPREHVTVG